MSFIYFSEQEKQAANEADIVSFLQRQGQEVKRCGREYMWDSPSGKVSINGSEWYSQYERVGGGAVSFVQKFFDASYPNAIKALIGDASGQEINNKTYSYSRKEREKEVPTEVKLPEASPDKHRLYGYLLNERCLDRDVVHAFIHKGILYEDAINHNAVFVGLDENGVAKHIQKRSTNPTSDYKGNVTGSDIAYAFHHTGTSDRLFVFEAPIDMLSYISMHKNHWEYHSYVALCSTADCAAIRMLKANPHIGGVFLCLDHDSAGIEGAYRVAESIHALGDYVIWRKMPKNKDWNEDLKELHGKEPIPASEHKKLDMYQQKYAEMLNPDDQNTPLWKNIANAKGYVVDNFLSLLHSELRKAEDAIDIPNTQNHLKNCVTGCIAYCYCRDEQLDYHALYKHWSDKLRTMYKPHKDTGSSTEQWSELKKSMVALDKELSKNVTLTESNICEHENTVMTFAVDCIRLCSSLQLEQTEQSLTLNLE